VLEVQPDHAPAARGTPSSYADGQSQASEADGAGETSVTADSSTRLALCPTDDSSTGSAPSFVEAAYRSGTHSENLQRHRDRSMFDRSSFTRIRPLASRGSWMGNDPLSVAKTP
jgi:hypothetical protein